MLDEKLSALMDGELTEKEVDELLERLDSDAQLREAWSRQHLASTTVQENMAPAYVDSGFADRVMGLLEAEPSQPKPSPLGKVVPFPSTHRAHRGRRRWYGPVAGLAVAASVAAVAVMVVEQPSTGVRQQASSGVVTASTPNAQPVVETQTVAESGPANGQEGGNTGAARSWDSGSFAGFDNLFRTVSSGRWAHGFEETALGFPTEQAVSSAPAVTQHNLDVTQPSKRQALEGVWLNHNSYPNDTGLSSMMGYMRLTAQETASTTADH